MSKKLTEEPNESSKLLKTEPVAEPVPASAVPVKPEKPPKPIKEISTVPGPRDFEMGDSTVIPNYPLAKLMYYLHCLKNCVDVEINANLIDYRSYRLLSETEKRDVVIFAHRYRPEVLKGTLFFEVEDSHYLLPKASNNFIDFSDPVVVESFNASNAVIIDGVTLNVKKIMIYKYAWMLDFFSGPFHDEKWRIGLAPKPLLYVGYTSAGHPSDSEDIPFWCLSGILCCFIFPPVGLVLLAVGACRAGQETQRVHDDEVQVRKTTYIYY